MKSRLEQERMLRRPRAFEGNVGTSFIAAGLSRSLGDGDSGPSFFSRSPGDR